MQILPDFSTYEAGPRPLILALGNFDGVHLGHRELLTRVTESARSQSGCAGVMTFREHPQHVLHPSSKPPLLTSLDHKLFLLSEYGIETCFLMPFTAEFAGMDAESFVRNVLVSRLGVKEVYLGRNARFGRNREGDAAMMERLSAACGFRFYPVESVLENGEAVSSSRIRVMIREGRLDEAQRCLGRKFSVFGRVVHGSGRGGPMGFPTANLEVESEILPPLGVYPVEVRQLDAAGRLDQPGSQRYSCQAGSWMPGILNYGYRPTFREEDKKAVPEVYLFDFKGDLYNKRMEIRFHNRLRPEMAFGGVEALKTQIQTDIESARRVLERAMTAAG